MTNFLKSKAFLATLAGLSIFRIITVVLNFLVNFYGFSLVFIIYILIAIAQTVILFGLLARNTEIKLHQNGIRIVFLLGLLGNLMIAIFDFITRRSIGIPLNPLELLSPIITMVLPIFNLFYFDNLGINIFILAFWIADLILYYGVFIAALLTIFKKNGSRSTPVSQNVKKQPAQVNRAVPRGDDLSSQIIQLKELYDNGTLSEEEFKKAKSKLLS
jgi:hypothetical protein